MDWQIIYSSALTSAIIGGTIQYIVAKWAAGQHKLRKLEEAVVASRFQKSNELQQKLILLEAHLSPVAKGVTTLEIPHAPSGEAELEELTETRRLLEDLWMFVRQNAVSLGQEVYITSIYYEAGFDQFEFQTNHSNKRRRFLFYAFCRWVWEFSDNMRRSITLCQVRPSVYLPTTLEEQSMRAAGYRAAEALIDAVEKEPDLYSIDQRNNEIGNLLKKDGRKLLKKLIP